MAHHSTDGVGNRVVKMMLCGGVFTICLGLQVYLHVLKAYLITPGGASPAAR